METKCWKERGMKHTHLDRWTCASSKWMILRQKWNPRYRIAHGWKIWVWICLQGTWELMKQKEPRSNFVIFYFYFCSHFVHFLFFFFLFSLLFFSSHHHFFHFQFFFGSSERLQHSTYTAVVRDDVMTPPMLEWCSSSSIKEGGNDC
jgi:hypothetical protein